MTPLASPPRIGVLRTELWQETSPETRAAVTDLAGRLRAAGALMCDVAQPDFLDALADDHPIVMAYEAARSLAWEHHAHRDQLSPQLRDLLDLGKSTDPREYDRVKARRDVARTREAELFRDADALITPAAAGEAPEGLASTGDPRFAQLWTLLGLPSVSIPAATGPTGLPVGVQLIARTGQDAALLATAAWVGL
jgi:amidase